MRAYVGETRAKALRARLAGADCGLVILRGRTQKAARDLWPRWFYDNGAFTDYTHGREFDQAAFEADVPHLEGCDFAVLPDLVGEGQRSLERSLSWLERLPKTIPWALAVQDGMTPQQIPWGAPFGPVFVGGTKAWKWATVAEWAQAAHQHGRICHVGRVGSIIRVRAARAANVDSIDSSLPLWSTAKANRFLDALRYASLQQEMFG